MKNRGYSMIILQAACLLFLASCAATTMTKVWNDESFRERPLKKVFVIAVSKDEVSRRSVEDEFRRQLGARGADVVASYTVLPSTAKANREMVEEKMRETGTDVVLVMRLVNRKKEETYVPGSVRYASWGSYTGHYVFSPGYVVEDEFAVIESNIYNLKSGNLVWSAQSETLLAYKDQTLIREFVGKLTDRLAADGLVGK